MPLQHLLLLAASLPAIYAAGLPNLISENQNRQLVGAKFVGQQVETPVRVLDIADTDKAQVVRKNGRLRVEVKADASGFKPDRLTSVKSIVINAKTAGDHLNVTELDGYRPKGK